MIGGLLHRPGIKLRRMNEKRRRPAAETLAPCGGHGLGFPRISALRSAALRNWHEDQKNQAFMFVVAMRA
jgi:hypothetical protein